MFSATQSSSGVLLVCEKECNNDDACMLVVVVEEASCVGGRGQCKQAAELMIFNKNSCSPEKELLHKKEFR